MRRKITAALSIALALSWMFALLAFADDVPRISKEKLRAMLENPDISIIDVRSNVDWLGSHLKIRGASREDPRKVSSWLDKYPKDRTLVLYCA